MATSWPHSWEKTGCVNISVWNLRSFRITKIAQPEVIPGKAFRELLNLQTGPPEGRGPPALTFEWGLSSCHQEESLTLLAAPLLADVVAQLVAVTLLAAQAQALAEAVHVAARVADALRVSMQQGVDEEVHRPLVGAFYGLGDGCNTAQEGH